MQKYELSQWPDDGPSMEPDDDGKYYLASEVDARIAELRSALKEAEEGLRTCYQVCDYPANGRSNQDFALAAVRAALEL